MKTWSYISLAIITMLTPLACSSSEAMSNFEATLSNDSDKYCSPFVESDLVTCIISINIKNITDVPQRISGTIYGYADKKVYKASVWLANSIDTYEDVLNPGETKGSVVAFDIPKGSTLTKVFVGPTPSLNKAIMTLTLAFLAQEDVNDDQSTRSITEIKDYTDEPTIIRAQEGEELARNALNNGFIILIEEDTYTDLTYFCKENVPEGLFDNPQGSGEEVYAYTNFVVGCINYLYREYKRTFGKEIANP